MNAGEESPGGGGLLALSFIADLVGILGFLGLNGERSLRIAVGASLALVGLAVAGVYLFRSVRFWASPEGAFRTRQYHRRRIGSASLALVAAIILAAAVISVVAEDSKSKKGSDSAAAHTAGP